MHYVSVRNIYNFCILTALLFYTLLLLLSSLNIINLTADIESNLKIGKYPNSKKNCEVSNSKEFFEDFYSLQLFILSECFNLLHIIVN